MYSKSGWFVEESNNQDRASSSEQTLFSQQKTRELT